MSRPLSTLLVCASVSLALAAPSWAGRARKSDEAKAKTDKADKGKASSTAPRPILLVANEVIERAMPSLLASPKDTAARISVMDGLIGLGSYDPRGGADFGMHAPPRHLFPRAGAGNSLNVDPNTGRSYFTNTP
jgi:hypothetical protein